MIQGLPRWLMSAAVLFSAAGHAQTVEPLPPETRLVSVAGAPTATEDTFTVDSAQDLTITLTDLQVPAALSSATLVVTQGAAIVGTTASPGSATLVPPATSASVTIAGAVGQYTARVVGAPNASYSIGTFTLCVAPKTNPSSCIQSASLVGNISTPGAAADPTVSTLSQSLTVATGGTYTVSFADDDFPVALSVAPNVALFQGSAVVALNIASGTTVNLNPGTYTLLAIAQADPTVKAGLYGIAITGPLGVAPILNITTPVGNLAAPLQVETTAVQSTSLQLTDFAFPTALGSGAALATSGATVLGMAAAGSPATFSAPLGSLQVWSYATAGTDAGTYEVDLLSGTTPLLQFAAAVNGSTSEAYAFLTPALAAGSYAATASDFQFPAALQGLQFAVAQSGSILGSKTAAGSVSFTAAAGAVVLLVDATPPTAGNGLFDVNVQTSDASASTPLIFDKTGQVGLSGVFDSQTIVTGTAANFDVTLTDLNFPAQFQDLAVVVSSGGTILGRIFGGGTFTIPDAQPGSYQLTFVATPAAGQDYGLYGVSMVFSAPTVTLSASPTTVLDGATTTLTWTTQNASSCTGSGASFAGNQATSGSVAVVVSATTTYSLTCTGDGGSTVSSVTVTAAPAPAHSGGGGGVDLYWLGFAGLLALGRAARGSRTRR